MSGYGAASATDDAVKRLGALRRTGFAETCADTLAHGALSEMLTCFGAHAAASFRPARPAAASPESVTPVERRMGP